MEIKKNILITGLPGVGKTTLIMRLCDTLKERSVAGFYTSEVRGEGVRKGFSLVSLDGRQSVLSHVETRSSFRVGKYGVDVKGFEDFLDSIDLEGSGVGLIVIDEIGKMECLSENFRRLISRLLDSGKIVIATIALKGEGFISQIKQRPDAQLYEITTKNRDSLVFDILSRVERIHG
ncbi:MAG: NTPase [Candidatus Aminicenantales bacterium]